MGKKTVRNLIIPYAEALLKPIVNHMESQGYEEALLARVKANGVVIAQAVVTSGLQKLIVKWTAVDWESAFQGNSGEGIIDVMNVVVLDEVKRDKF